MERGVLFNKETIRFSVKRLLLLSCGHGKSTLFLHCFAYRHRPLKAQEKKKKKFPICLISLYFTKYKLMISRHHLSLYSRKLILRAAMV